MKNIHISNAQTSRRRLKFKPRAKPSNVRVFLVQIPKFYGRFCANFDILTPRWLPTRIILPVGYIFARAYSQKVADFLDKNMR